jgi:hypothetical protein
MGVFASSEELLQRISELKNKKADLIKELEALHLIGVKRVEALEKEVAELHSELEISRDFFGQNENGCSNKPSESDVVRLTNEAKTVKKLHESKDNIFYF